MTRRLSSIVLLTMLLAGFTMAQPGRRPVRGGPNFDEYYNLGPDSLIQRGVPHGEVKGPFISESVAYPGTQHKYWVYVPAQYDPAVETSLLVTNDGAVYIRPDGYYRAPNVLDNLIYRGEIPVMIAVFIDPGEFIEDGKTDRARQYNTMDGKYASVVIDEVLPNVTSEYNISTDPERHAIAGWSSGAIAAFTVAWQRPDYFHKVLNGIGAFVDFEGGDKYADIVRASEKKPIRIFMIDGRNDNRALEEDGTWDKSHDMFYQNVRLKDALVDKGYDVNFSWGIAIHSHDMGGAMMPEMMRWLWRDHPVDVDPHDKKERAFRKAFEQ